MAPKDYAVIYTRVPFVDVVTTMLDASIPLTTNEYDEWGNPADKASYDYMLSYSPYDNVAAQAYPALFVSTGLWDSQVQYYEPTKWVARLRARKTDANPLVFRVNMEAGHGGKSGPLRALSPAGRMDRLHARSAGREGLKPPSPQRTPLPCGGRGNAHFRYGVNFPSRHCGPGMPCPGERVRMRSFRHSCDP
ncbi:MAG: prolyl oligopeptidase family serine peptidase [Sphingomonas sp.]